MNLSKSIIMSINRAAMQKPILDQLFSWRPQKMTYLGLQILSEIIKTYQLNYTPLLKKVGEELDWWWDLPISLTGRVNCVKINILPKFFGTFFKLCPFLFPKFFSNNLIGRCLHFCGKGNPQEWNLQLYANHTQKKDLPYLTYSCITVKAVWVW